MHVADHALLDQFLGFLIKRRTAILRAHLHYLAGLLPDLDDIEAFFDGVGQRFFDIHVLAGLERRDRHVMVQMLGRHDVNGVDGFVGQQLVIVVVGGRRVAPDGLHAVFGAGNIALIGVADGGDLDFVGCRRVQPVQPGIAARTHANPADVDLVIGAARRDHSRSRGNRGRFEKIAPIQFIRHNRLQNSIIPLFSKAIR